MAYSVFLLIAILLIAFRMQRFHQDQLDEPWHRMIESLHKFSSKKDGSRADRRARRDRGSADAGADSGSASAGSPSQGSSGSGALARAGTRLGPLWPGGPNRIICLLNEIIPSRVTNWKFWPLYNSAMPHPAPISGQGMSLVGVSATSGYTVPPHAVGMSGGRITLGRDGVLQLRDVYCTNVEIGATEATSVGVTVGGGKALFNISASNTSFLGNSSFGTLNAGTPTAPSPISSLPRRKSEDPIVTRKHAYLTVDPGSSHPCFKGIGQGYLYHVDETARHSTGSSYVQASTADEFLRDIKHDFLDCTCGFYAYKLDKGIKPLWSQAVLDVELMGRVIVASEGYRAERQRVLKVWVNPICNDCDEPATGLRLAAYLGMTTLVFVSTCDSCIERFAPYHTSKLVSLGEMANGLGTEVSWWVADEEQPQLAE